MTSHRGLVLAAFAILYVVWGSTYLAMHYAVETIPPLLMAGVRFTLAGALLYAFARLRGAAPPVSAHVRAAGGVGSLLMAGNACVALAVQRIPSGVAALFVATTALFLVLIDWARPHGRRPSTGVAIGLLVGLGGVAILVGPGRLVGGEPIDPLGAGTVLLGTLLWAAGSIRSRHVPRPKSALVATALHMVCGGLVLLVVSLVLGEPMRFDPATVSARSIAAFLFLLTFGSLLGFTAYIYLLGVSTPARVSTYAYVNPVVAVFLGWAVAGERISARIIAASVVIIAAVALITTAADAAPPTDDTSPRDAADDATAKCIHVGDAA